MDLSLEFFLRLDLPYALCRVDVVEPESVNAYRRWIDSGRHGSMEYLARYDEVRANPALLLEGARSMILVAFPYRTEGELSLPIALYARGRDYHEVVREQLRALAAQIPGETRVCVDTAPLRERYWAVRAGLGRIGRNNQLFVPGYGSYCFIGTILTTAELPEHRPFDFGPNDLCGDCERCVRACPGGCILPSGEGIDARKCISYLTIEHRGEFEAGTRLPALYGCDVCQRVCPLNRDVAVSPIEEFRPTDRLMELTADDVAAMTPEEFSAVFRHSAIKRTKLAGLQRNLRYWNQNDGRK